MVLHLKKVLVSSMQLTTAAPPENQNSLMGSAIENKIVSEIVVFHTRHHCSAAM